MSIRIERITGTPVRVPVSPQLISCPPFEHEPLNRGADGGFTGPFFADVPLLALKVEGGGATPGWCTSMRTVEQDMLAEAAGRLIGKPVNEITPQWALSEHREMRGLQTAAMDFRGRVEGKPLHALLGPLVRDRVAVAQWSGFHTPQGAAAVAQRASDRGIRALKVKANEQTDGSAIARAVVAACGRDFELCIDPNGRWTRQQVFDHARAMGEAGTRMYLEDPAYLSINENVTLFSRVRRETNCHIAKTVIGPDDMATYAGGDAVDVFNLQGIWAQVLTGAAEAHRLGVPFWAGSSIESGLNDMERIHLAATQPAASFPFELAASQVREHNLLTAPIAMENGFAIVPDTPGLGVDVDLDALERYRVGDPIVFA